MEIAQENKQETNNIKSEAKFTFLESTGVIVGHGVGSGILSVPFVASLNKWWIVGIVILVAFLANLLLHLMIAELSYNNKGAQFVECLKATIFKGKLKTVLTIITFALLALSVIMNCCSYVVGSSNAIQGLFALMGVEAPLWACMLGYYVLSALVVFFGMKFVGICEKYCLFGMIGVVIALTIAIFFTTTFGLSDTFYHFNNILRVYSLVSFALSAVMSVPTVVKGSNGNKKQIIGSITLGTSINILMVIILTVITIIGCGPSISQNGAIIDLSAKFGGTGTGWGLACAIIGYLFTLLALSTSLWANTLNLRDMFHEQFTKLNNKVCWAIVTAPIMIITLLCTLFEQIKTSFFGFASVASVIQVVTNLAVVVGYGLSRKKTKESPIVGVFGSLPFMIFVIAMAIIATVGSVLPIYGPSGKI